MTGAGRRITGGSLSFIDFHYICNKENESGMKSEFKKTVLMGAVAGLMVSGGCGKTDSIDLIIGTYGEYIHMYSLDLESLVFSSRGMVNATDPSYAIEDGDNIFAVSECGNGSGVYSFQKTEDGDVRQTAELRQTGNDPCFLMLHEDGNDRYLMTADYSGGSVSVFPIKNGTLQERCTRLTFSGNGPVASRQESSHIHQLKAIPETDGRYMLATDLGADVIRVLEYIPSDTTCILKHVKDVQCPPGSGPRHMEFGNGKNGLILYCIAELSGEVLVYEVSEEFRLIQQIQADEVNAGGSADIHIHPSGKWLYTSHRLQNDGISIFDINEDGTLDKSGYMHTGRHPRNFMITDDGRFLLAACRDDMVIQVFRISKDGGLAPTEAVLHLESDRPSSITSHK